MTDQKPISSTWSKLTQLEIPHPDSNFKKFLFFQGNNIYLLGCSDSFFRKYSLQNKKWVNMHCAVPVRDNFLAVSFIDFFIIFGGFDGKVAYGDIWRFDCLNSWKKLSLQLQPRQNAQGTALEGQRLLIMGGINSLIQKFIYQITLVDINKNISSKLHIKGQIIMPRLYFSISFSNSQRIILFGGYSTPDQYLNDLYEMRIRDKDKLVVDKINSVGPSPRCSHTTTIIDSRYMFLYGGQCNGVALSDEWMFEFNKKTWSKIFNRQSILGPRYNFPVCKNNKIFYFFGGMRNNHQQINDLLRLQIYDIYSTFQNCNSLKYTSNLIKGTSQFIANPFQAIALFIDNALMSDAQSVQIRCFNSQQQNEKQYKRKLQVQYDSKQLDKYQFLRICQCFQSGYDYIRGGKAGQFGLNLKLGASKIGSNFLFIQYFQNCLKIAQFQLFQKSGVYSQGEFRVKYFMQKDKQFESIYKNQIEIKKDQAQQAQYKKTILQYINNIDQKFHNAIINNTLKYSHNIFVLGSSLDPKQSDFKFFQNEIVCVDIKKIKLYQELKLNWKASIDICLRSYLSYLFTDQISMKIFLVYPDKEKHQINQVFCKLLQENQPFLKKIQYSPPVQSKIKIFQVFKKEPTHPQYWPGILIYHYKRLISRIGFPIGSSYQRLCQGHKLIDNNFQHVGMIVVGNNYRPNLVKSDFQKQSRTAMLDEIVRQAIAKAERQ